MTKVFAEFIVGGGKPLKLTYLLPVGGQGQISSWQKGMFAMLPFRNKQAIGVFWQYCSQPHFECLEVFCSLRNINALPESTLALAQWIANYYVSPIESAVLLLAPGFVWNIEKFKAREKRSLKKQSSRVLSSLPSKKDILLTEEQVLCSRKIFNSKAGSVTLLQGVTGSGKTEVYLDVAAKVVFSEGKTVLVLVPEIALTPQMTQRFRAVFVNELAVLHSGLSALEYEREWFRVSEQKVKVVLGVRTAVFAPLKNVGLLIVDEEHDSSYKAEDMPCFNARDVAVVRSRIEGARCILGSATPSLESIWNVQGSKYQHVFLQNKFSGQPTRHQIIDSKKYLKIQKNASKQKNLQTSKIHFRETILTPPVVD
ncbi:MAG: DEAD/DEAH box helicase, partial [Silvanigrellaceae bacterium]|nr:DEAD/DEAH box helicase [Silvanigrellaceae bacterium]